MEEEENTLSCVLLPSVPFPPRFKSSPFLCCKKRKICSCELEVSWDMMRVTYKFQKPEEAIVYYRRGHSVVVDYSDQARVTSALF